MSDDPGTQKIKRDALKAAQSTDEELTREEIERLADLFAAEPPGEDEVTGTFAPAPPNTEDTGEFKPEKE